MDQWEAGRYAQLVRENEDVCVEMGWGYTFPDASKEELESKGQRFENAVLDGRLRSAVRQLTNQGVKGILQAHDTCSKTGRPVLDVLKDKMPRTTVPSPGAFSQHPDRSGDLPTPVDVWEEDIAEVGGK